MRGSQILRRHTKNRACPLVLPSGLVSQDR